MNPIEFLKTIYFGDRHCTKIVIDSKNRIFEFHVNQVSRIRDISGQWNYYIDEDILNGIVIFTDIKKVSFEPQGFIPNDEIYSIQASKTMDNDYMFTIETCNIDSNAKCSDVNITIIAKNIFLKDPLKPGLLISD